MKPQEKRKAGQPEKTDKKIKKYLNCELFISILGFILIATYCALCIIAKN